MGRVPENWVCGYIKPTHYSVMNFQKPEFRVPCPTLIQNQHHDVGRPWGEEIENILWMMEGQVIHFVNMPQDWER